MELIAFLVDFILHVDVHLETFVLNYGTWVYALLFLIIFVETGVVVMPFLPGDSLLFVVGAMCGVGLMDYQMSVGLLFAAASETLVEFGENPRWLGGSIAATLVLHTWGQTLTHHPHVHALVAGGAFNADGGWIAPRRGFLFPVQALSKVFRGKFLGALSQWLEQGSLKLAGSTTALAQTHARRAFIARLRAKAWVVYAKQTLTSPEHVLDYLGRYTHKAAISNERLLAMDEQGNVRFSYRNRARGNQRKTMQLPATEFLARFLTHVLPRGFMRIRHYGLAASRSKRHLLPAARGALGVSAPLPVKPESVQAFWLRVAALDITLCPACRIGHLCVVGSIKPLTAYRARAP